MESQWIYTISYLLNFVQLVLCAHILSQSIVYRKKLRPYLIFSILTLLSFLQNIALSLLFPIERKILNTNTTIISLWKLDYFTTNKIIIHIYSLVEFFGLSFFLLNQIKTKKRIIEISSRFAIPIISGIIILDIINPRYRFVKILIEPLFLIFLSAISIVEIVYGNNDLIRLKETNFTLISSVLFLYSSNLPNSLILNSINGTHGEISLYYSLTNVSIYIIFYSLIANAFKWKIQAKS